MDFLSRTDWEYDTSEETGYSGAWITGGEGHLYFKHQKNPKNRFSTRYTFISAGFSKGSIVNFSKALTSDTSVGTNVRSLFGFSFGPGNFPCKGWMVSVGGTAGVFQPSFMDQSGGDGIAIIFGLLPFAGLLGAGRFNSLMPTAGASIYFVAYEEAKDVVGDP